jgi:hypothetical protein
VSFIQNFGITFSLLVLWYFSSHNHFLRRNARYPNIFFPKFGSNLMCHNPIRSILRNVPQFHKIVTHHVGTKFWKKVLECQAFLVAPLSKIFLSLGIGKHQGHWHPINMYTRILMTFLHHLGVHQSDVEITHLIQETSLWYIEIRYPHKFTCKAKIFWAYVQFKSILPSLLKVFSRGIIMLERIKTEME